MNIDDMSLNDLRRYAANELGIKGASKILGGRAALISRINAVLSPPPVRTEEQRQRVRARQQMSHERIRITREWLRQRREA